MNKISNCCGSEAATDICEDIGICPACGEHCEFVTPCKNEDCDGDAVEGQEYCINCLKKEAQHA